MRAWAAALAIVGASLAGEARAWACFTDYGCSGTTPICSFGTCVACKSNSDCGGNYVFGTAGPNCDLTGGPLSGSCFVCSASPGECPLGSPVCDSDGQLCVACEGDYDPDGGTPQDCPSPALPVCEPGDAGARAGQCVAGDAGGGGDGGDAGGLGEGGAKEGGVTEGGAGDGGVRDGGARDAEPGVDGAARDAAMNDASDTDAGRDHRGRPSDAGSTGPGDAEPDAASGGLDVLEGGGCALGAPGTRLGSSALAGLAFGVLGLRWRRRAGSARAGGGHNPTSDR
jgi:hypothetical protein